MDVVRVMEEVLADPYGAHEGVALGLKVSFKENPVKFLKEYEELRRVKEQARKELKEEKVKEEVLDDAGLERAMVLAERVLQRIRENVLKKG